MKEPEKLRFSINGFDIFYTATDINDDGEFISFVDRYGKKYSYRKSLLIGRLPVSEV